MAYKDYRFVPQAQLDIEQALNNIINEFGDRGAAKKLYDGILKRLKEFAYFQKAANSWITN